MTWLLRHFEAVVCAALLLAMTALGFANVVVRYASDLSLAASEEFLTAGFVLLTVFGGAVAARRGDHLAVTVLADAGPRAWRIGVFVVSAAASVLLLGLSAWFCWALVANQLASGMRSYALDLPIWIYAAPLPLGFALILIRYAQHARAHLRDLLRARPILEPEPEAEHIPDRPL